MDKQLTRRANQELKRVEQRQPPPRPEQPKGEQRYADFKEYYEGKEATILLHNGTTLKGRIVESRPYFLKLSNEKGEVLYVNKAYVVLIRVVA